MTALRPWIAIAVGGCAVVNGVRGGDDDGADSDVDVDSDTDSDGDTDTGSDTDGGPAPTCETICEQELDCDDTVTVSLCADHCGCVTENLVRDDARPAYLRCMVDEPCATRFETCASVAALEVEATAAAREVVDLCDANWGDGCCGIACEAYAIYEDSAISEFRSCFDLDCAAGCECMDDPLYYGSCPY
jgi:hypothetical protein